MSQGGSSRGRLFGRGRPTSGKVLQALFNILGDINGLSFLDLFAGSGRVTRRALELGALVTAVELDGLYCREISVSAPCAKVVRGDVRRFIPRAAKAGESYHVVFADPPYCSGWVTELLGLIADNPSIVITGGILVIEHSLREPVPGWAPLRDDRVYGETVLSFFYPWHGGDGV